MDIPEAEIEQAAASMIAEFGAGAAQETRERAAEAEARGFDYSAQAWRRVLVCIERFQDEGHGEAQKKPAARAGFGNRSCVQGIRSRWRSRKYMMRVYRRVVTRGSETM